MRDAEAREKLVQQLETYKHCGGLLLRNMPGSAKGEGTGKREALLLLVILAGLENEEEEKRLMKAQVEIHRHERGGRKTQDLKIFLEDENVLLRKVWRKLEKVCRQEGIRRYQIETKTKVSPVKAKPLSELEKAKEKVMKILEKEKNITEREEAGQKLKEKLCGMVREWCLHLQAHQPPSSQQLSVTFVEEVCAPKMAPAVDESEGPKENKVQELQESSEDETEQGGQGSNRLRKAKWLPAEGWRRCGKGCSGCASKCADQGLEDCQGCHLNKSRSVTSNSCLNREACVDLKEQKERRSRSKQKKTSKKEINIPRKTSPLNIAKSPAVTTKVNSQVVVSKLEFVKEAVDALEEKEDKKRPREETGKTPEQEKKASKIALPMRKAAGGKEPLAGRL